MTAPTPSGAVPSALPLDQQLLVTPLRPLELERELANHPNKSFVSQLIHNIRHGCSIGYVGPEFVHIAHHLPSALAHPLVIDEALQRECQAGRMAGPYRHPPCENLRCSGLGVVPKKDGGSRVIYHLSAPHGYSINDFINPLDFSLLYCSIDDAIAIVNQLGPGTLMAKIDLKNAFRLCPVRPQDWHYLGIHWEGAYYIDKCLPFGLRSAPYLFNLLAEAIEWIAIHNYGADQLIHYLDDFFTAGPPASQSCHENMRRILALCEHVNAPVKSEKVEGPTTTLTFLGIQLDSLTMQASITADRKDELLRELRSVVHRYTCTKQELLSLIGKLSFATKVVPPGRIFLRRLIDLSTTVGPLHHHVTLNKAAHLDIQWWLDFLPDWPGTSLFLESTWVPSPQMELFTDASDVGYGAYWSGRWFSAVWSPAELQRSIAWRELFAIVTACATWGSSWMRKRILFHCDNASVVDIWRKGSCIAPDIMSLVRTLYFLAARGNYHIGIAHIPGAQNRIADLLSRLSMQAFRTVAPQAAALPDLVVIPANLMQH